MHPDDVTDHVLHSVEALRDRLAQHPGLQASEPLLEGDVNLYIEFEKEERALTTATVGSSLLGPGGQATGFVYQVPLLGAPPERLQRVLRLDLTDYDGQPPTAELLLPDRTPLPREHWPHGLDNLGIVPDHPDYDRPFFCRRGLREYHTHPDHEDDPWDRYREHLALDQIVLELLTELKDRWIGR